jgi:hypothetical protein
MQLPPILSLISRPLRVAAQAGAVGELLHVEVTQQQAGRWVLALHLSLPDPPDLPPPLEVRQVTLRGALSRRTAPLRVESIRWADYPWGIDVVLTPAASRSAPREPDHDEFVVELNLTDLLAPERNAASFRLDTNLTSRRSALSDLEIDYLTKDYQGFRAAILRRIALSCRDWTDRSPADVGITVVELLAYAADYTSQFQDAVAVESYLATARLRTSVKRHARLLDYAMEDGRASRLWINVRVSRRCTLAAGTQFLVAGPLHGVLARQELGARHALDHGVPTFESITDQTLDPMLNELALYAFGGRGQVLPQGACHAVLVVRATARAFLMGAGQGSWHAPGAVLAFVPDRGGELGDAHLVRLVGAEDLTRRLDPGLVAQGLAIVDVHWATDDALPHMLQLPPDSAGPDSSGWFGVRCLGNFVLTDFGATRQEVLQPPEPGVPYRPTLSWSNVVPVVPVPDSSAEPVSASALGAADGQSAVPALELVEIVGNGVEEAVWRASDDLLSCLPDERAVAVDIWQNDTVQLRFGDGRYGRKPAADRGYRARYRVGDLGRADQRPGAITALVLNDDEDLAFMREVVVQFGNLTPSAGVLLPEPIDRARARAPQVAQIPLSCATLREFIDAAEAWPDVAQAVAWLDTQADSPSIIVAVRSATQLWTQSYLITAIQRDLASRCLIGRRVTVLGPALVPLEIVLDVRVSPGAQQRAVRAALERRFAADGDGFFAPASISFGQIVFASAIATHALAVPGIASATLRRLARGGAVAAASVPAAVLLDRSEIPLVVNTSGEGQGWIRFDIEPVS